MRGRCPLGIPWLSDAGKHCRDRSSDIITKQDRDRPCQTDHTAHSVSSRLNGKVLENGNRRTTALYYQGHDRTGQHTKHRYIRYLVKKLCKHRAVCQRLHHTSHSIYAKEKQAKGKNGKADIFYSLGSGKKGNQKSHKDDQENIITDLKCYDLCCHRRSDIRTKNNRDRLWQRHQACADKADRHDCRSAAALQYCCCQCACQYTKHRIFRKQCQNGLHFFSRRLLQAFTHHVHAIDKNSKTSKQPKQNLYRVTHLSPPNWFLSLRM